MLRVGWCTVVRQKESELERVAGSHGAPETHMKRVPWLPLDRPQGLDIEADWVPQVWRDMDTSLAAAPLGDHETAIVLGRAGGPETRPSEVARLAIWPESSRRYCADPFASRQSPNRRKPSSPAVRSACGANGGLRDRRTKPDGHDGGVRARRPSAQLRPRCRVVRLAGLAAHRQRRGGDDQWAA